MKKTIRAATYIDSAFAERVAAIASYDDLTIAQVLRDALRAHVGRRERQMGIESEGRSGGR